MHNPMRVFCGGLVVLFAAGVLEAQVSPAVNWPEPMFETLNLDFGVVAKGADAKMRLKIVNKYPNPVHILAVGQQCKCATPQILQDTIAPGETGYIEVTLDTKKFEGHIDKSVTVHFDRPQYAEVRIPVKAYIRNDVEIGPGKVEFGNVAKGTAAERRIHVVFNRPGVTLRDVICRNKDLNVKFGELGRNRGGLNYEIVTTLKATAPVGEFRDQLTLVTDDPANPNISVVIDGRVEAEFTLNSELLDFGELTPGGRQTIYLIIKGRRAFSIEKIESDDTAGVFLVQLPKEASRIHKLPLTVVAPSEIGTLRDNFTITIPGSTDVVTFKAHVRVVPATAARPQVP